MKIIRGTQATTHPDRHGDQLTVGALVKNADDTNKAYYPLGLNHDPRIPPIGRIFRSFVVPQEGGHAALMLRAEQFEEGDTFDLSSTPKRLAAHLFETEPEIIYDNSFDDPESAEAVSQLAMALRLPIRKQTKKAYEPLTVLVIVLSLTAAGFFAKLGEDLYALVKKSLGTLMKRRANQMKVLVLRFKLKHERRDIQAEISLTNAMAGQIEALFNMKGSEIEIKLTPLCSQAEVVKVVAEFSGGMLVPKFALRADGVPFDSSGRLIAYGGQLPSGLSISFQHEEVEDGDSGASVVPKRANQDRSRSARRKSKPKKS